MRLLVLAIFFPGIRKFLLWVAALLIFGSLAFWAFFFVLVLLQRGNRSSGYGSSGGFGGGFSGGGGSTGSW